MKDLRSLILVVTAFLVLPSIAQQKTSSFAELYKQGVEDYKAGNYKEAVQKLGTVAKRYPRNAKVQYYLRNAKMRALAAGPKNTMERDLRSLVVQHVEFEDADLNTVFAYLSQKAEEMSDGRIKPNFIYQGSAEDRAQANITLKLSNVPMTDIIRYVGEITRTRFKYDAYAIMGTPLSRVPTIPLPETEPAQESDPFA